jgi:hypothetical protein
MSKLTYVTDPELIARYVEAERRRKKWFEEEGCAGFFHERLDLMEGHGRRAAGGRPTS